MTIPTFTAGSKQGIELMHMIKKGQMVSGNGQDLAVAGQFYSLPSKATRVSELRSKEINAIEPI